MEGRARCSEKGKVEGEMGRGEQEKYNRKPACRRTQEHSYFVSELHSLTQHNLTSLLLCALLLTQLAVGWAPGTIVSQLEHSMTISFTTPQEMRHMKPFKSLTIPYHACSVICYVEYQSIYRILEFSYSQISILALATKIPYRLGLNVLHSVHLFSLF